VDSKTKGKKNRKEKKKPETQNYMKLQTFFHFQPSFFLAANELCIYFFGVSS